MKNDISVHRTNATIFFMSEYAYRHLWYKHGGQALFDYVSGLEKIFEAGILKGDLKGKSSKKMVIFYLILSQFLFN